MDPPSKAKKLSQQYAKLTKKKEGWTCDNRDSLESIGYIIRPSGEIHPPSPSPLTLVCRVTDGAACRVVLVKERYIYLPEFTASSRRRRAKQGVYTYTPIPRKKKAPSEYMESMDSKPTKSHRGSEVRVSIIQSNPIRSNAMPSDLPALWNKQVTRSRLAS